MPSLNRLPSRTFLGTFLLLPFLFFSLLTPSPNQPTLSLVSIKAYLPGRGSPGTAKAFHIDASLAEGKTKPQVLVSADDGGWVDLLVANSEDAGDWTYSQTRVVNSTGTIGTPDIGDVNGDGMADFFVPLFAENKLAAYTFAPEV